MKSFDEIKKLLAEHKETLENKYKVKSMGVFGSFARGKQKKKSDIDILVEFSETPDLFEFLDLEEYLKKILGRKVDLVTKNALKPLIKDRILSEVVYV